MDANEQALRDFHKQEQDQDDREKAVRDYADNLIENDSDYNPFSHDNIMEALCNCPEGSMLAITSQIASCEKNPDNPVAAEATMMTIRKTIRDYWDMCAMIKADMEAE